MVGSIILTHWGLTTIKKILFYMYRSNLPSSGEIKYSKIWSEYKEGWAGELQTGGPGEGRVTKGRNSPRNGA